MAFPDFDEEFKLYTDASSQAIGASICQVKQGVEKPIAYYGRALTKVERNYTITELEGLAVVNAVDFFYLYLRHSHFIIFTDHAPLTSLFKNKNPKNSCLLRWILFMSGYDYEIKYRTGKQNQVADALSRRSYPPPSQLPELLVGTEILHCGVVDQCIPLKETSAVTVAKAFFQHVICRHGCPRELLSDRGTNFLSKVVQETCKLLNVLPLHTSSYNPRCNGLEERWHATLAQMLSMYVDKNQKDWDEYLPAVCFAFRASPSARTSNHSPFLLVHGREPALPLPENAAESVADHIQTLLPKLERIKEITSTNLAQSKARMKAQADMSATPVPYKVGDKVYIHSPQVKRNQC